MKRSNRTMVVLVVLLLAMMSVNSQPTSRGNTTEQLSKKMRDLKEKKKREREKAIKRLEVKLRPLMKYSIEELKLALTLKVTSLYGGTRIYADNEERTYLGTIDDEFASDSIFNDFGTYGSEYSSNSIWNEYGTFGGEYSSESPFNVYSSSPPFIVKERKVVGRLTVNEYVLGAVDPSWLKSYFKY